MKYVGILIVGFCLIAPSISRAEDNDGDDGSVQQVAAKKEMSCDEVIQMCGRKFKPTCVRKNLLHPELCAEYREPMELVKQCVDQLGCLGD